MIDHLVAQLQAVLDQYKAVESRLEAVQRLSRFRHILWYKETLNDSSEDFDKAVGLRSEMDRANLITSQLGSDENSNMHAPVLDLDFYAHVEPSSTPGHFHLFLDKAMKWQDYQRFLVTLASFDIIEQGFMQASIDREASAVRLPWVKKGLPSPTLVPDGDGDDTFIVTQTELARLLNKARQEGYAEGKEEGHAEALQADDRPGPVLEESS